MRTYYESQRAATYVVREVYQGGDVAAPDARRQRRQELIMCGIAGVVDASRAWLDADARRSDARVDARARPRRRGHVRRRRRACSRSAACRSSISKAGISRWPRPRATASSSSTARSTTSSSCARGSKRSATASPRAPTPRCILHAYRQWGVDCVAELDGMFAFALWDTRLRRLLLARDRFGKKPLYYYARRCAARVRLDADGAAAASRGAARDRSRRARRVPRARVRSRAAHHPCRRAQARRRRRGSSSTPRSARVESARYWELRVDGSDYRGSRRRRRRRARGALASGGEEAARRRRAARHLPLGRRRFLDGGGAGRARARRHRDLLDRLLRAVVRRERVRARRRRAPRHAPSRGGRCRSPRPLRSWPTLGDDPRRAVADGSIVPTYLLSRFARRHVTVALGGDGGDELFAGYPTYLAHRLLAWRGPLARPSLLGAASALAARLPVSHDNFSFDFKLKKLTAGARRAARRAQLRVARRASKPRASTRSLGARRATVCAAARARYHEAPRARTSSACSTRTSGSTCATRSWPRSTARRWPRRSRCARRSSTPRSPSSPASLPLDWKLHRHDGKCDLEARRAPLLAARASSSGPKKGFGMPIARWLRGDLDAARARRAARSADSLARRRRARSRPRSRACSTSTPRGTVDHRQRLWALLVLELWRRKNLLGATSAEDRRRASTR